MLLGCSSNGIVMLVDTHPVEHAIFCFHDISHFAFLGTLLDSFHGIEVVRCMQVSLPIAHLLLGSLSWGEVASPVILWVVRVWEHVVVFHGPGQVLCMKGVEVLARRWVKQRDVGRVMFVEILNQPVHLLEVEVGVGECEVTAKWNEHVVSKVVGSHFVQVFLEVFGFLVSVVSVPLWVHNEWLVVPETLVVPESLWPAVVIPHGARKDLFLVSKMLGEGSPQVVHGWAI